MQAATTNLLLIAILFLCNIALVRPTRGQEADNKNQERIGYTSEFIGRSWAIKKVLPTYPEEAIKQNISGVVEVAVGRDYEGKVVRVHVPPGLNSLLKKAAVAAAKQWRFEPFKNPTIQSDYTIFRLTFNFVIKDGKGWVELYNPPLDSPAHKRMRGAGPWDVKEWGRWEDATEDN